MAKTVSASALVEDYTLYPRAQVDAQHVREMVESLKAGGVLPPIIVDRATMRVVDGFHRLAALRRVYGADAEIPVVLNSYVSEADIFESAMRLNAAHGRNLTSYDKARAIYLASQLGIEKATIASALNLTLERVDHLQVNRMTADGVPLKYTMAHMAGTKLDEHQGRMNQRAGGMSPVFYINQVSALLDSGSLDLGNAKVMAALRRLDGALESIRVTTA